MWVFIKKKIEKCLFIHIVSNSPKLNFIKFLNREKSVLYLEPGLSYSFSSPLVARKAPNPLGVFLTYTLLKCVLLGSLLFG